MGRTANILGRVVRNLRKHVPANVTEIYDEMAKAQDQIIALCQKEAKKEYEESDLYKIYLKYDEKPETLTPILLQRWNKDILITLHYVEKNCGVKIKHEDLIKWLQKTVDIVKQDHENFIKRYSR